jgi:UTP--glucose-1-phosphate uridylyltransferase
MKSQIRKLGEKEMNYKTPTKAVLSDAGFASRYLPITKSIPKSMLPMGNKPVMQLVVEECVAAGIRDIIIVATESGKPVYEDYFNNPVEKIEQLLAAQGKTDRFEPVKNVLDLANITVITQDPSLPYGNGSPFVSARPYLNEDEAFLAFYSDDLIFGEPAALDLLKRFEEKPDASAIIGVQEVEGKEIEKYAAVKFKKDGEELERLIEKPKMEEAPSFLASMGRYLLTPEVFKYLNPTDTGKDGELWTADGIDKLAGKEGKVYTTTLSGIWYTSGDPKNFALAYVKHTLENDPSTAAEIRKMLKK